MRNQISGLMAATAGLVVMASAAAADCGSFKMAEFNWPSGELMANVDKVILEEGYGCDIELVVGGTSQIFTAMNEKGEPQIAGEQWVNALRDLLEAAVAEGRIHSLNLGPITGLGEGWWVTDAFVKAHPELDTVEKVIEHPELFPDAEDPEVGAFVGCPAGWGCQRTNTNLFRAFDMEEKGWKLVDPGSAAGLDGSLAKAAERGENWIGYYWSPTSIVGKYNMHLLDWETPWAGAENWNECIALTPDECQDPQRTSYTESAVHTVVTDDFMKGGGDAVDYLRKRVFPGDVMNGMLFYMEEEQASGADAAIEFLIRHKDVWKPWVSDDAAAKIEAAL